MLLFQRTKREEEEKQVGKNSKSSKSHSQHVSLGGTGSLGIGCALTLIWAALVKVPLAEVQGLHRILLGCAAFAPQTGSTYLGSRHKPDGSFSEVL